MRGTENSLKVRETDVAQVSSQEKSDELDTLLTHSDDIRGSSLSVSLVTRHGNTREIALHTKIQ